MANTKTFVYIASNPAQGLFVGVSRDLEATMGRHRAGALRLPGLDQHTDLVYVEQHSSVAEAVRRSSELNRLSANDLRGFIRHSNPDWSNLASERVVAIA